MFMTMMMDEGMIQNLVIKIYHNFIIKRIYKVYFETICCFVKK